MAKLLDRQLEAVEVGPTFDQMDSIDDLLSAIQQAEGAGFQRVGLKFRPGWDLPVVRAVCQAYPEAVLHIDGE